MTVNWEFCKNSKTILQKQRRDKGFQTKKAKLTKSQDLPYKEC